MDEYKAEVLVQNLLDHTSKRVLEVQEPVLLEEKWGPRVLVLLSKWGFDSATGQKIYHQPTTQSREGVDEESLFVTNLVPLRPYDNIKP